MSKDFTLRLVLDSWDVSQPPLFFPTSSLSPPRAIPAFARKLGVSPSHLCDIEKGRKVVGPQRAARFARILGRSSEQFVRLSLQELVDEAGLKMKVNVAAA